MIILFYLFIHFAFALSASVLEYGSDFDSKIGEHDVAMVKFYAPWCGHCKQMAPEYEKAATKLKTEDPPITLIKVDCTTEKEVCEKYGVSGYPTLKIFKKGAVQNYEGPRDYEGIVKYMKSQAGPSSKEIKSAEEFETFKSYEDGCVIGFFETETKLKDSFNKVADTERDRFRFGYITDAKLIKKTGYNDDIIFYTPKKLHNVFDPNEIKYDGNYDTDKIREFLMHETTGLAGVRTPINNFQFDRQPRFVVYYDVDYVKNPSGSNYWRNRVLKVAKEFKRKAYFAVSNKKDFSTEVEEYGLKDRMDSDKPLVAALTKDGKFFMDNEFSVENLKDFVKLILSGKAEPYMKSEPVPSEQGDLKVAVGRNFKTLIMDAKQDALIEFYAPWCGHCKALAPKYEELATKLAKEDVIIAKFDATANDVPPMFEVQGFPTIFWLPKNTKKPVSYSGPREVNDFVKYIAEHSTDGLKGYDRNGKKKKKTEL